MSSNEFVLVAHYSTIQPNSAVHSIVGGCMELLLLLSTVRTSFQSVLVNSTVYVHRYSITITSQNNHKVSHTTSP